MEINTLSRVRIEAVPVASRPPGWEGRPSPGNLQGFPAFPDVRKRPEGPRSPTEGWGSRRQTHQSSQGPALRHPTLPHSLSNSVTDKPATGPASRPGRNPSKINYIARHPHRSASQHRPRDAAGLAEVAAPALASCARLSSPRAPSAQPGELGSPPPGPGRRGARGRG